MPTDDLERAHNVVRDIVPPLGGKLYRAILDIILEAKAEEVDALQVYCLGTGSRYRALGKRAAELRAQKSDQLKEGK